MEEHNEQTSSHNEETSNSLNSKATFLSSFTQNKNLLLIVSGISATVVFIGIIIYFRVVTYVITTP